MYKKIITHRPDHHADDFVGTCLVKAANPNATIETVSPHDPRLQEWLDDPEVALVDVGRFYEPATGCFDHHQDADLECAAVLVARMFGYTCFAASKAAAFMTTKDLKGFEAAAKEHNYRSTPESARNERILVNLGFGKRVVQAVAATAANCSLEMSYDEFVEGILRAAGVQAVGRAKARIASQNRKTREALTHCELVEHGDFRVVISEGVVSRQAALTEFKADIVIARDHMDGDNTMIAKDSNSPRSHRIDLSMAAHVFGMEQLFCHNSGFIAVLKGQVHDPKAKLTNLLG